VKIEDPGHEGYKGNKGSSNSLLPNSIEKLMDNSSLLCVNSAVLRFSLLMLCFTGMTTPFKARRGSKQSSNS
jgi:hypothetical protein